MFADPISNLMLIILLLFAGLLVMFFFILRNLEQSAQNSEEIRQQLTISLSDLERKVAELSFALQDNELINIENMPQAPHEKPMRDTKPQGTSAKPNSLDELGDLSSFFAESGHKPSDEATPPPTQGHALNKEAKGKEAKDKTVQELAENKKDDNERDASHDAGQQASGKKLAQPPQDSEQA